MYKEFLMLVFLVSGCSTTKNISLNKETAAVDLLEAEESKTNNGQIEPQMPGDCLESDLKGTISVIYYKFNHRQGTSTAIAHGSLVLAVSCLGKILEQEFISFRPTAEIERSIQGVIYKNAEFGNQEYYIENNRAMGSTIQYFVYPSLVKKIIEKYRKEYRGEEKDCQVGKQKSYHAKISYNMTSTNCIDISYDILVDALDNDRKKASHSDCGDIISGIRLSCIDNIHRLLSKISVARYEILDNKDGKLCNYCDSWQEIFKEDLVMRSKTAKKYIPLSRVFKKLPIYSHCPN